jgi:serine/arginine repetitive matrix protein 2
MYDEQQHQQRLQYPEDMEARPAIEVIEMANGETVWSIVNGLREDEEDDTWDSRASFISTASLGEQSVDGVQLFFKEHGRTASKGSQASLARAAAPKKPRAAPGGVRPETKVFYSNPEQIARIIEELSRGADSGAFNIMPSPRKAGHAPAPHRGHASTPSAASSAYTGSDGGHGWSVEERLDRMIGQMHGS